MIKQTKNKISVLSNIYYLKNTKIHLKHTLAVVKSVQ